MKRWNAIKVRLSFYRNEKLTFNFEAGFKEKYVNVAKRFYHVEEKLRRRETEREKNDTRLKLTLEKVNYFYQDRFGQTWFI